MSKLSRKRSTQPKSEVVTLTSKTEDENDDANFKILPSPNVYSKMIEVNDPSESELRIMRETDVILLEEIKTDCSTSIKTKPPSKPSKSTSLKKSNEESNSNCAFVLSSKQILTVQDEGTANSNLIEIDTADQQPELRLKDEVLCPFCWKKLNDKLMGMAHVKNCGKNLPTERIFEALQLHEKQVREWEYLGIAYPGFQQNPTKGRAKASADTATGKTRTARGGGRKKKDPELDLALALSASLHEEIETRKRKEKEYLVEIGLEKEVEEIGIVQKLEPPAVTETISDAKAKFRIRFGKQAKLKLPKCLPTQKNSVFEEPRNPDIGRRRGGASVKTKLTETALYKITEAEREDTINRRVVEILEDGENENEALRENYRMNDPVHFGVTNDRLEKYKDEKCKLWKLATSEEQFETNFYTPAIIESKKRLIENSIKLAASQSYTASANPIERTSRNEEFFDIKKIILPNSTHKTIELEHVEKSSEKSVTRPLRANVNSGPLEQFTPNLEELETPIPQLAQDLLRLFVDNINSDLTIYGREEKPIRVHKLIIMARCPKLLQQIVVEEFSNKKKNEVIPLTCFSHAAVKSFVWFLYSGRFLPVSMTNGDGDYRNVEEEVRELCQMFNLSIPQTAIGVSISESVPRNSILKANKCKYAEKEVKTGRAPILMSPLLPQAALHYSTLNCKAKSPIKEKSQRRLEIDLRSEKSVSEHQVNVFEDSGDAILELCATNMNCRTSDSDSSSYPAASAAECPEDPEPVCTFVGVDENSSSSIGGSVDLFEEFFPEEKVEIEKVGKLRLSESLKKRSRSLSPTPSWESSFNRNPTESQANKKFKFLEDKNKHENVFDKVVCDDDPSLVILDDSDAETVNCNGNNIAFNISNSGFFKDVEIPEDLGLPPFKSENHVNIHCQGSPVSSRFNLASRVQSQSQRLSIIPEYVDKERISISSFYNPRSNLFSPVPVSVPFDHNENYDNDFPSSPPLQQDPDFPWDNYDSLLGRISENYLDIPEVGDSNPDPDIDPKPVSGKKLNSHSRKPAQERSASQSNDNDDKRTGECDERTKAKTKTKGKKTTTATVKINGRQRTRSETFETGMRDIATPNQVTRGRGLACRTPLLNYSTIDTPILKDELKKYGLKPLPRSKAKVLLRYIYTETHKPDSSKS